jgi:hypothetical protein
MFANAIHVKMLNGFRQGVSDGSEDHDHDDTQITTLDGQINGAGGLLENASPQTGPVIRQSGVFTIINKTLTGVRGIFFHTTDSGIPSTTKMLGTTNYKVVDKTSDFESVVDDVASLNTLLPVNANGDTLVGVGKSLLFGAYNFTPVQYKRTITDFAFSAAGYGELNRIFVLGRDDQPGVSDDWVNQATGETGLKLGNNSDQGFYKMTFTQIDSTTNVSAMRISADICYSTPNDNVPQMDPAVSFSFNTYDGANFTPPVITLMAGFLKWEAYINFPGTSIPHSFDFPKSVEIRLTRMPY